MKNQLKMVNGNYVLYIDPNNGNIKRITNDNLLQPKYPEIIDLKIIDFCSHSNICKWCFQSPDKKGKNAKLENIMKLMGKCVDNTELKLTGGNPLEHPNLKSIIKISEKYNVLISLDLHYIHVTQHKKLITSLLENKQIFKLYINVGKDKKSLKDLSFLQKYPKIYYEFILGINSPDDLQNFFNMYPGSNILLHGYKSLGRGSKYRTSNTSQIDDNINLWKVKIKNYIYDPNLFIDEVASHQLNFEIDSKKKAFKNHIINRQNTFSMYIDIIDNVYAAASYDLRKTPINNNSFNIPKLFHDVQRVNLKNFF